MHFFTKRVECMEKNIKTVKYFLRGTKVLLAKKQWDIDFRQTFVLGRRVSYHTIKGPIIKNKLDIKKLFSAKSIPVQSEIDIVVPVYNGYDFLEGLFKSIKENTDLPYRLFVVNDASPDERVLPLLKKWKTLFDTKMRLIENKQNLGFLKSVNLALEQTSNHVVLINTDVILPKNWASKLLYPIIKDSKVASVTPFSNCATIFSVPNIGDNNFDGDLESVNKYISKINAPFHKLIFPTGVGFCMAINKNALAKVGVLDEIFERGYGEENDWCQRAINKGFYNTIAADLFVWHKHGASFGSEKFDLIKKHLGIINSRYKKYNKDVEKIQKDETYLSLREFIKILFFNSVVKDTMVWFCHNWGGGADIYAQKQIEALKQDTFNLVFCTTNSGYILMSWFYKEYTGNLYIEYEDIRDILKQIKIKTIIVNSLASWSNIPETLDLISNIKKDSKCAVSFRGHDFMPMCPSICMINNNNIYCSIKSLSQCKLCKLMLDNQPIKLNNLGKYQDAWRAFFKNTCDEVIVFSESSYEIYATLYPETTKNIKIIPHKIPKMTKPVIPEHDEINIAVLGAISITKGLNILLQIDKLLKKYKNVKVFLIGYTSRRGQFKNIVQTGKYSPNDLPKIMEKNNIDIVFIPSIWPETFSYTTQEAIEMGINVACFNLGAPAERVKKYKKGLIIDKIDAKYALDKIINFVKNKETK